MQPFFQQTILDGTPLWIVVSRDVIIPGLAIVGSAIAFSVWYGRKKKEHKLMHQTRAYEILLNKELKCYEELLSLFDNLIQCGMKLVKFDDKGLKKYHSAFQDAYNFFSKNTLYLQDDIKQSIDRYIEQSIKLHHIMLAQNEMPNEEMDDTIAERFDMCGNTLYDVKIRIKKHLEDISRIN